MAVILSPMKQLISKEEIHQKILHIAEELNELYQKEELIIVAILKGSICFVSDLIRQLTIPFQLEFIKAASYGMRGTKPGELEIEGLDRLQIEGKKVFLVDDIFDTGKTLHTIKEALEKKAPQKVETLVLLNKILPSRKSPLPDRICFDIGDNFVVGYGLDYKEYHRGLEGIYEYQ